MVEMKENELYSVETDGKIWSKIHNDTQNHAKRIKDLIALAQDSRIRIDALLGRRTVARDFDDSLAPLPNVKRISLDESGNRRSSRGNDGGKFNRNNDRDNSYEQTDWDRHDSRDGARDRSDRERHGNRDQTTKDTGRIQETSEQIITHKSNQGLVDVGGVTITTSKHEESKGTHQKQQQQKQLESVSKVEMSPQVGKKPFKFGTVSLQVKLD